MAQAHLTSGLWHPCQGTRPGTALRGILGPCSLLAPPLPAAPTAAGVGWGQSGLLALCWDPVGSSGAGLRSKGDEEQATTAAPQAGSHCPRCEGRVFWCNNYPCTTGSPIEFLFTYLLLHVQTKSPSVVVLWEDVSPFLSSPQPAPACPLGSTTSVPSATHPPRAGSLLMQYSMSSVGHAQLALELGIGFFCN